MFQKVTKKVKTVDLIEEIFTKDNVFMKNIASNPVETISTSRALLQLVEDYAVDMTKTTNDYEVEIKSLKDELAKAKS